jgi:lysyl endopeptidase
MYRFLASINFYLLLFVSITAQDFVKRPFQFKAEIDIPIYTIPQYQIAKSTFDEDENSKFKTKKIASKIPTELDVIQFGTSLEQKHNRITRFGVFADGAEAMSFIFSNSELPAGSNLYAYSGDGRIVKGPFNRHHVFNGVLLIDFIQADTVFFELRESIHQKPAQLQLESIGYSSNNKFKDGRYGLAGDCNIDINCDKDDFVQQVKNAVVRLLIDNRDYCSGALINNTAIDGKVYVLTANHCVSNNFTAERTIFYFNYESPYCNGPDKEYLTISNAQLIATSNKLDFSLLEISQELDFRYKPYFAGWNVSGDMPGDVYSIHHPEGDVKKISYDEDELSIADFGVGYDDQAHWLIWEWDGGTTEGGSSGGPLFDNNNMIIGDLSGGFADCDDPVRDYYQMIHLAWDKYSDSTEQLKNWLDPIDSNITRLGGYDPYLSIRLTADTLSNIAATDETQATKVDGWGYLSGHSSLNGISFAEKFELNETKSIIGFLIHVAKSYVINDTASVEFNIYAGDEAPTQKLVSKELPMDYFQEGNLSYVEFANTTDLNSNFFISYTLNYTNPLDTFAVYHSSSASINSAFVDSGNGFEAFTNYNPDSWSTALDIRPILYDSISTDTIVVQPNVNDAFVIYPNPVTNTEINFAFKEYTREKLRADIYDISGKKMNEISIPSNVKSYTTNVSNLTNGVYFVTLTINASAYEQKLIIQTITK